MSRIWQEIRWFVSPNFSASNAPPRLLSNAGETDVPGVAPHERSIRVFISSTFRDMQNERDVLMKFVFPQLRKFCEERGVTFTEVDLRWGITEEQSQRGEVLPICLAEIENCRPFFIGLLGERYGWVPPQVADELVELQPWLAEHRDKSVTELEILHGVLNNPDIANRAVFYFRDPAYVKRVPAEQRGGLIEANPVQRGKLAALKERVRQSGLALRDNYPDPPTLGQWVLRDLTAAVNQMYPPGRAPGTLERDAAEHEAFASSRAALEIRPGVQAGVYIGRPEYLAQLDAHATGDGPPLVVLGESGSGKSALLANWALHYRHAHPDTLVLLHFIGATPYSADWAAMLRRILGELMRRFDIKEEIPDKPDALRAAFANWLQMAAARGRVVLVLDGLNQLEDCDGALELVWLPPVVPNNVRLVLSTLPGKPLAELEKRQWPTLTVRLLEPAERRRLIADYLAQYTKRLNHAQVERIAGAPQAANPLYLRALLDELRVFGVHELLDRRIDHYLGAQDVAELYSQILERWEADYERDRPNLVRDATTALWAARRGLAESELLEVLGTGGRPLPRAVWSPLFLALGQALVVRSGLIGFFHEYLREAVRRRYLPAELLQQEAHLRVADYFTNWATEPRGIEELPWQLTAARSWTRLSEWLANLEFFARGWKTHSYDIKRYWTQVEQNSPLRAIDAYLLDRILKSGQPEQLWLVAQCLGDLGYYDAATRLFDQLLQRVREQSGNPDLVQGCLFRQACIVRRIGKHDKALEYHRAQEDLCRQHGLRTGLASSLTGQAMVWVAQRKLAKAHLLYDEAEQIYRDLNHPDGLAAVRANRAEVYCLQRYHVKALALLRENAHFYRQTGNPGGLAHSIGLEGLILQETGKLDEALVLLQQQERIAWEFGIRSQLHVNLGNQGKLMQTKGDYDAALRLHKQELHVARELGEPDGIQRSLGNQATVWLAKRKLGPAIALLRTQERVCAQALLAGPLAGCRTNQASVLRLQGQKEQALRMLEETQQLCRSSGSPRDLAMLLANQAALLTQDFERPEEAVDLALEADRLCEHLDLWEMKDLAQAILDRVHDDIAAKARSLHDQGDLDGALARYEDLDRLCMVMERFENLANSMANRAAILAWHRGKPLEGIVLLERALAVARMHDLSSVTDRLADQLRELDDQTLKWLQEAEQTARHSGGFQELQRSLGFQAQILDRQGKLENAMALYLDQEQICRDHQLLEGLQMALSGQSSILEDLGDLAGALAKVE
ncbi:MAG TPA: DUF4062 domain-containing protein, partial [Gemmataceae bacterium]|nr:DUF4062 domain-containing protein [Gemmataceae bacterium]